MKILITGSRSIKDEKKVFDILDSVNNEILPNGKRWCPFDLVIHGGAEGVDSLAEKWCEKNHINSKIIRPINSDKISYLFRDVEMITMVDFVIVIYDGISKGTKFTLDYAKARGMDYRLYMVK